MADSGFEHEQVRIARGARSGVPLIIAVHSTALGMAVGGCRMWHYPSWREGLDDALLLSEAMSLKCALAGLELGGGKAVVALPLGVQLPPEERRDVLHDLGDLVASFRGAFGVGEDVGMTPHDMAVIRERTRYSYGLPEQQGGMGDPAVHTAKGVYAAIQATCSWLYGTASPRGHQATVIGLGHVGSRLARSLVADGAQLAVSDIDPERRSLAEELGARWVPPDQALAAPTELLVPAALGGMFNDETVDQLQCKAVIGPANNQLVDEGVAERLAARGILWAPDFLVNAGGVIYGGLVDVLEGGAEAASERVLAIGQTLLDVYEQADKHGITPFGAAITMARERIAAARTS